MSHVFLKVKIKALAAEARIIRFEEQRHRGRDVRASLSNHRKVTVRQAARHTLLAYGYLRGRSYHAIERTCDREPDWNAVEKMVKKYGPAGAIWHGVSFEQWSKGATMPESLALAS